MMKNRFFILIVVFLQGLCVFGGEKYIDLGTVSKDQSINWNYDVKDISSIQLSFKITKTFYLSIKLNGEISYFKNTSTGKTISVNRNGIGRLELRSGDYSCYIVSGYRMSSLKVSMELSQGLPGDKIKDEPDKSSLPNVFPEKLRDYIKIIEPIKGDSVGGTDDNSIIRTHCYDWLGRNLETVYNKFSPNHKDVVILQGYDHYGRVSETWKPVEFADEDFKDGEYIYYDEVQYEASLFYNDTCPYIRQRYEHNPLERKCGILGCGQNWRNNKKNKEIEYLFNNNSINCIEWREINGIFENVGNYDTGELSIVKQQDEDGNITYEFSNQQGQKVMYRKCNGDINYDTYYIYDMMGNLRYILPPAISDYPETIEDGNEDIMNYAYIYEYDGRKRCVRKKQPGCAWVLYRYDKSDHVVLMQDGEMRKQGRCFFYGYDKMGRKCVEGTCRNTASFNSFSEIDLVVAFTGQGIMGYEVEGMALETPEVLNAYYYDNYSVLSTDFIRADGIKLYGVLFSDNTINSCQKSPKGLATVTISSVIGEDAASRFIISANCYDTKNRVVLQASSNIIDGIDKICYTYTFRGSVRTKRIEHILKDKTVEVYNYSYDHAERLKDVTYSINGKQQQLSSYLYDGVGKISQKNLGDQNIISYKYNIKDWISEINSASFNEKLFFEESNGSNVSIPSYYNGNIGGLELGIDGQKQACVYQYDQIGQLTSSNYVGSVNSEQCHSTEYEYDKNGNVTYLQRNSLVNDVLQPISKLYFTYDGNQLIDVRNTATANIQKGESTIGGYSNSQTGGRTYNSRGSVIKEEDKDIVSIDYNILNLPQSITFKNGNKISYLYSGQGEKLQVVYKVAPTMVTSIAVAMDIANTLAPQAYSYDTLRYCGNMVYRNDTLLRVLNDEGFATPNNQDYTLHYFIKDHLSNVRIVADTHGNVEQTNDYYPFGSVINGSKNTEMQPYKYNGKELDRMNGLDWYDYGARMYESDAIRWGQVDPLCEKKPDITPYAYCSNNPILRIDPTGEYDFEGTIGKNTYYPVIAVFPNSNNKDLINDKLVAKEVGMPIMVVENLADFADAMKFFKEQGNSVCCYTINSHGAAGNYNYPANFDIGNEKVDLNTDFSALKSGLQDCVVFIGACNVGSIYGRGDGLVENMASATNSIVIASDHKLKVGYPYDGSDRLNYMPKVPYAPTVENGYIMSNKGNLYEAIKDVRIDKKLGITWGSNIQWDYFNSTYFKY